MDRDMFGDPDPYGLGRQRAPGPSAIIEFVAPAQSPRILVVAASMLGVLESAGVDRNGIIPALDPNVGHFESPRPLTKRAKRRNRGKSK